MCEAPARQWREFLRPQRVLLGVTGAALITVGYFMYLTHNSAVGVPIAGLGGALLIACFFLPALSQVEYGFPFNLKVTAALRNREAELRQAFEDQRPDFELCAKLLCDDAATAQELLTAGLARATLGWRGPVGPQLRVYALCWFVHRLVAHHRLVATPPTTTDGPYGLLSKMTLSRRIIVVLNEIADLDVEQIALIIERPPSEVEYELSNAKRALATGVQGNGDNR